MPKITYYICFIDVILVIIVIMVIMVICIPMFDTHIEPSTRRCI